MNLTSRHLENPVAIVIDIDNKRCVQNEAGEILFKSPRVGRVESLSQCLEWCEKNFCAPIPKVGIHDEGSWKEWSDTADGYPAGYYEIAKKNDALLVICACPETRRWLEKKDPMALRQVEEALGNLRPTKKTHPQTFGPDPISREERIRDQIREQRKWIDEHGGNKAGYIKRYGTPGKPGCYGMGGEKIYEADLNELKRLEGLLH